MYRGMISLSVDKGLMLSEAFPGQYDDFITWIRIYRDHWLSSAAMYEPNSQELVIEKYARLFIRQFYAFLTPVGREVFVKKNLVPDQVNWLRQD